jgi:hypothetical protein
MLFVNGPRNEHVFKLSYFIGHVSSGEKDLKMWQQTEGMAEKSKHPANWQAKYNGLYIHNANLKLSEGQIDNYIIRSAPNSKIICNLQFVHKCL